MAVAGAGAGAEIMDKVGTGAENKLFSDHMDFSPFRDEIRDASAFLYGANYGDEV